MDIIFKCFYIMFFLCILFGFYNAFKKQYAVAIGNILIPIFLVIFYTLTAMQLPGTLQVDEMTYFMQQLQKFNPFAIFTSILFIMFFIVLIWDIRVLMHNKKHKQTVM